MRTKGMADTERAERLDVVERPLGDTGRRSASLALIKFGVGGSGRIGMGAIAGSGILLLGETFPAAGDAGIVNKLEARFEFPLLEKLLILFLGGACEYPPIEDTLVSGSTGVGGNADVGGGPAGPTEYLVNRFTNSERDEAEPEPPPPLLVEGLLGPPFPKLDRESRWWPPTDERSSSGAGGGATFGIGRGGGNADDRGPKGPGMVLSRLPLAYEGLETNFELFMLPPPEDSVLLKLGASVDMVEIRLESNVERPPAWRLGTVEGIDELLPGRSELEYFCAGETAGKGGEWNMGMGGGGPTGGDS